MAKINREECKFLKSLDDKWKWIARDRDEILWIYEDRPEKFKGTQTWDDLKDSCVYLENDLFQFIQWEDSEPYNIQELIDEYLDDEYGYFNMKLSREFEEFIEKRKRGNKSGKN